MTFILNARRPGSAERYFNDGRNLNAANKMELLNTLVSLQKDIASGKVTLDENNDNIDTAADVGVMEKKIYNAYKDYASGEDGGWKDLGAVAATTLTTTMARTGFARTLLKPIPFQTDPARIEIGDESNVVAVISDGYDNLLPHYVSDRFIDVPYVEYKSNPRVFQTEINRGFTGLVEKVYTRALQGIGVQEDRYFMKLIRAASNSAYGNAPMTLLSGITPAVISQMRQNIEDNGIPAGNFVIGRSLLAEFAMTPFNSAIDPVSQYEVIRTGRIGTLMGFNMIVDGFRPLNLNVMDPKEMFAVAEPEYLGGFGTTGPITAVPRDNFDDGQSARGWFMSQFAAMGLGNAKAVQLARRT